MSKIVLPSTREIVSKNLIDVNYGHALMGAWKLELTYGDPIQYRTIPYDDPKECDDDYNFIKSHIQSV